MTIRTVGQLIDALTAYPPWRDVVVEVTVGGDLVTDVVDLELVDEAIVGTGGATAVRLKPAEDVYDTRALIDDGLLLRARIEDGTLDRDALEGSLLDDGREGDDR